MSTLARRAQQALPLLTLALMLASLAMVFLYAPQEQVMGEVQRIFYFHVASAWIGMLAFLVVAGASLARLLRRTPGPDRMAGAAAEIGVLFTTVVLLTGPLWAKAAWGAWWTWDPRLTSALAMWLLYTAYLALRSSLPPGERRERFCAVYALVAFLDVPVVFFSIRWWRTIHPNLVEGGRMNLEPEMLQTLLMSCAAFTLLFLLLMRLRLALFRAEEEAGRLRLTLNERMLP